MSSEVKRITFFAYLDDEVAELDHHEDEHGACVWYSDYAALEAENARLNDLISAARRVTGAVIEERDAALAQLAAIQQAKGEGVEEVAYVGREARMTAEGWEDGHEYVVLAEHASDADKRYDVPLMTVAQHQRITAAMAAEVDDAKSARDAYAQNAIDLQKQRDALRAELASVKGQEAVATIEQREPYEDGTPNPCKTLRWAGDNAEDDFPAGTKLYALPPASPDVEGLVKALEKIAFRAECFAEEERDMQPHSCEMVARIAQDALSTWRQSHP